MAEIYVSIMFIFHKFIEYSLYEINIQHSMLSFHKEIPVLFLKKHQVIMTTTTLEYLEIHSIFVYDVFIDYIAKMKCQLHHLHLEQHFIQQNMI